ncbi:M20 family metallopeptidase [Psychrobacillus lasiicapitis]|uniref:Amidohydrolase n=1 Tax=Psychrobacillus lasiicapitis TaxID=1636719 RepID=A0A544T711_9BACI|nr:M20 family metallopeptidase [Psychrobacillus lasiicapitis]TQR13242.1 amidohydrolase [Psychrobacillus lasiicapitis]GGA33285.1 p-aminobenzoyl-glutamate hydrolase subunit B [Psychrobacillus lasiicapitis]
MDNMKDLIGSLIEAKSKEITELSDQIWDTPETRFQEHKSTKLLSDFLEDNGFSVERGVGGIETAFTATFGQEKPVIGILGEFDALSGLSQKEASDVREALEENGNGHGCGHNLLGTAGIAAVVALKQLIEEKKITGSIKYFGCPGEEGGSGKTYMVREGVFNDIDVALTWHPNSYSGVFSFSSLANYQVYFSFEGKASHAANSPHLGRSALDAVELMNVGVNYLREHIISEAKVHYAVTNTGGSSPNVVQSDAEVLYLIRAPHISEVEDIYQRVIKIAEGAALMTETKVTVRFDKACSNYIPNDTLNIVLQDQLEHFGLPNYDDKELSYAHKMAQTITQEEVDAAILDAEKLSNYQLTEEFYTPEYPFFNEVIPYAKTREVMQGSTDVGDVSWIVPTAQFFTTCFVAGTPLHTWQLVSQGKTSLAHKGLLYAGKVLAASAVEVFGNPELIEKAKEELAKQTKNAYRNPLPKELQPSIR